MNKSHGSLELAEQLRQLRIVNSALPIDSYTFPSTVSVMTYSAGSEVPLLTEHQIDKLLPFIESWVRMREALWYERAIIIARDTFGTVHPAQVIFEQALVMARKQPESERMQPAGEANERNFGVKLERQGGE